MFVCKFWVFEKRLQACQYGRCHAKYSYEYDDLDIICISISF